MERRQSSGKRDRAPAPTSNVPERLGVWCSQLGKAWSQLKKGTGLSPAPTEPGPHGCCRSPASQRQWALYVQSVPVSCGFQVTWIPLEAGTYLGRPRLLGWLQVLLSTHGVLPVAPWIRQTACRPAQGSPDSEQQVKRCGQIEDDQQHAAPEYSLREHEGQGDPVTIQTGT